MRTVSCLIGIGFALTGFVTGARAEDAPATRHPALFLVGDSTVKTGTGNGERGPWGWGSEIGNFFDPAKLHVYNEARGGRSTRSFMAEGAWAAVLERLEPGDFVIVQFGHNETANSANHPDRATINAAGEESLQVGVGDERKIIHTYGWHLRQYVSEAQAKGAAVIICSPIPRNQWIDGRIKRGFDGYAQWAAEAARASGAQFVDLNSLAADRYDALGQEGAKSCFNDFQHTTKAGARLNAECVAAGIRRLADQKLAAALLPQAAVSYHDAMETRPAQ